MAWQERQIAGQPVVWLARPRSTKIVKIVMSDRGAFCQEYGAQGLNPLALWDMHWVKELDDEGFIDTLIKDMSAV